MTKWPYHLNEAQVIFLADFLSIFTAHNSNHRAKGTLYELVRALRALSHDQLEVL